MYIINESKKEIEWSFGKENKRDSKSIPYLYLEYDKKKIVKLNEVGVEKLERGCKQGNFPKHIHLKKQL